MKDHPRYHYQIESIPNVPAVTELANRVDVVFHLAAALMAMGVRIVFL